MFESKAYHILVKSYHIFASLVEWTFDISLLTDSLMHNSKSLLISADIVGHELNAWWHKCGFKCNVPGILHVKLALHKEYDVDGITIISNTDIQLILASYKKGRWSNVSEIEITSESALRWIRVVDANISSSVLQEVW